LLPDAAVAGSEVCRCLATAVTRGPRLPDDLAGGGKFEAASAAAVAGGARAGRLGRIVGAAAVVQRTRGVGGIAAAPPAGKTVQQDSRFAKFFMTRAIRLVSTLSLTMHRASHSLTRLTDAKNGCSYACRRVEDESRGTRSRSFRVRLPFPTPRRVVSLRAQIL